MPVIIFNSGVSVNFTINLPKCKNVNLTFSSAFASRHNNVKVQQYTCTKCIYKCILSKCNSHEQTLFQHVVSSQQLSFDLFFRNVSFGVMPATLEQFYMTLGVFLPRYVVYSGIFGYIDKWLGNQRLNRHTKGNCIIGNSGYIDTWVGNCIIGASGFIYTRLRNCIIGASGYIDTRVESCIIGNRGYIDTQVGTVIEKQ